MSLDHAILGFLSHRPMSGYDLKKHFDESIAHFWTATQSHIYKSLERLQEQRLVAVENIYQESRPNRKLYQITAEGMDELKRWVSTPLPLETLRMDWLIQVFFFGAIDDPSIIKMLEDRAAKIEDLLDHYTKEIKPNIEDLRDEAHEHMVPWLMHTLNSGIAFRQAELKLTQEKLRQIRQANENKESK